MGHPAEDYYDMPVDMLPSANFAGRPTSDICMLDGLWTMIVSSSSEEDEDDDNADSILLQQRTPTRPPPPEAEPDFPETPRITITSPLNDTPRPRRRSLSNDVKVLDHPRLLKKAQTAPPGALFALSFPPPEPRRAVSARLGHSNSTKKRQPQPQTEVDRSLTVRKVSSDEMLGPRKRLGETQSQKRELVCFETKRLPRSFSQKARVRETLEQKQMLTLNTALTDYESRMPNSPDSMLSTPRELYAIPEKCVINATVPSPPSPRSRKRQPFKPTSPVIHASPPTQSDTQGREVRGGAERQRIYLPGPVMLAQHPAQLRRDSVATLDPFSLDPKLESLRKRLSDVVGLDGLVMFFEDFDVVAEVTEATLDKYWLCETQNIHDLDDIDEEGLDARTVSASSMEGTTPKGPWVAQSPRESKFSFSSASSTASVPAKRKRNRLRGLLSPGLPGAAFLKSPATWG